MTASGREPESDDELWDPYAPVDDAGEPTAPADAAASDPDPGDPPWSADDARAEADGGGDTYDLSRSAPQPHVETAHPLPPVAAPDPADGQRRPRRRKRKRRRRDRPPVPDASLRTALSYPFEGAGLPVLTIYALLLGLSQVVPVVGPLMALVVLVWMGMLFMESASHTLEGIPGGPRFPSVDFGDLQVGLFGMTVMMIGILPYVVGRSMVSRLGGDSPVWELLLWPLPMYYLPMAFIVLADAESERGLDPRLVVRAIVRVGGPYLMLVTLAAAAFIIPTVTLALLGTPLLSRAIVSGALFVYLMVVLLRAVGILYLRRGIVSNEPPDVPAPDSAAPADSEAGTAPPPQP